jgi:hypothetical protein
MITEVDQKDIDLAFSAFLNIFGCLMFTMELYICWQFCSTECLHNDEYVFQ